MYTSQISDQDSTGLYYYNARYYNPTLAKFTQADSTGDTLNKYSYVANNPIVFTDPTGNRYDQGGGTWGGGSDNYNIPGRTGGRPSGWGGRPTYYGVTPQQKYLINLLRDEYGLNFNLLSGRNDIVLYNQSLDSAYGLLDPRFSRKINLLVYGGYTEGENYYVNLFIKRYVGDNLGPAYLNPFIIVSSEGTTADMLNNLTTNPWEITGRDTPGYDIVFLHEARHVWQGINDPEGEFSKQVTALALELGIIPKGTYLEQINFFQKGEYFHYVTKQQAENIPIRPHYAEDILLDMVKVSWTNEREIDAIIAETMMNPATSDVIKEQYPEMWNLMLSKSGYFNPLYFQSVNE